MKRDRRLHGLSSEHHHGLVLARRVAQGRLDAAAVRQQFDGELTHHFRMEEEVLLPALEASGEVALAARTRRDHAELRDLLAAAERGEPGRLAEFAALLERHIRFEEHELFPAAEERLSAEQLDRVYAAGES
jgi:hemerythrin-like domain-containing protein